MENNKKNNWALFALIVLLLLVIISLLVYSTFFNNKVKDDKEQTEVLTKDSYIVKDLYGYLDAYYSYNGIWEEIPYLGNDTIVFNELDPSVLNYIGYTFMNGHGIDMYTCDSELKAFVKEYSDDKLGCGGYSPTNSYDGDDFTESTLKLSNKELKKSVENIFGKDSYAEKSFKANGPHLDSEFVYYEKNDYYIYAGCYCFGIGADYKTTLNDVSQTEDTIVLNVNYKTSLVSDVNGTNYDFTYKLSNNEYYLYSVKKV